MQTLKQKRWLSILLFFAICGALVFWCRAELNASPFIDPEDHAIELVESLLLEPQDPSNDQNFFTGPSSLGNGQNCRIIIQEALAANDGIFNLESRYFAREMMTAYPDLQVRDVDEIYVTLEFPDGQIIDVRYYEGGLDFCAEK